MKERPIIFNSEMVKAILDGRKTQTRRPIKPQPPEFAKEVFYWVNPPNIPKEHCSDIGLYYRYSGGLVFHKRCPFGEIEDKLWIRETFLYHCDPFMVDPRVHYKADNSDKRVDRLPDGVIVHNWEHPENYKWRPSIHMPRWASRILLEITNIRVQRIQEITNGEVIDEGFGKNEVLAGETRFTWFVKLWNSTNSNFNLWHFNPWVWVLEFKRIK